MSEDERLELLETVVEAHTRLADAALALRRRLSTQSPLTQAAVQAEQESFRLSGARPDGSGWVGTRVCRYGRGWCTPSFRQTTSRIQ